MNKIEAGIQSATSLAESASGAASGALATAQAAVQPTDSRLSDNRPPTDGSVTDAKVASGAAIAESKLALASDAAAATPSRRSLGTSGTQAAAGNRGLPSGGATGQVPVKNSATDYDVSWANQTGAGGGASVTAQDEGSALGTQRTTWNFVGEGIDASDDAANTRTQIRARGTAARGTLPSSPQTNQLAVDTATVATGQLKQYDGSAWQNTQPVDPGASVGGLRTLGTGAAQAAPGNDSRFTKYAFFTFFGSGTQNAKTGVGHEIAGVACTLDAILISANAAPAGGTFTATLVKEAGGPGGTATTIGTVTLAAGSRGTTITTGLSVALAVGDCIRCDYATGAGYTAASAADITVKGRASY